MHFARLLVLRIDAVHAHGRLEARADVEEMHVQLAVNVFPQGVFRVVANGIELLRREVRQHRWQHLLGAHITFASQLLRVSLQLCKIEVLDFTISGCRQCACSKKP